LDAEIAAINAQLEQVNARFKTLPNIEQELLTLTRDVKVNNELYINLLNASQQLRLVMEGKVGNVRVVDVAATTKKPVKPQRGLVVALSVVLGLVLGVVLAFLRNSLRPGLKDPAEIEQHTGLHVFASVPHSDVQVRRAHSVGADVVRLDPGHGYTCTMQQFVVAAGDLLAQLQFSGST
jgi:tyrosine-protein kinase Etk/Wzc